MLLHLRTLRTLLQSRDASRPDLGDKQVGRHDLALHLVDRLGALLRALLLLLTRLLLYVDVPNGFGLAQLRVPGVYWGQRELHFESWHLQVGGRFLRFYHVVYKVVQITILVLNLIRRPRRHQVLPVDLARRIVTHAILIFLLVLDLNLHPPVVFHWAGAAVGAV